MSLKKLMSILSMLAILKIVAVVNLNAVTYEQLPNRPYWRGFYYWLNMADYPHILQSDMPYQVMQGYIVADSVVKAMPQITYLYNPIKTLNMSSDTGAYIYKYLFYMKEYDPLRFNAYLRRNYPEAQNNPKTPRRIHTEMLQRMYDSDPRFVYTHSDYILHIYVNNTEWIDTSDTRYPNDVKSETIAYCKVLDAIKGSTFPSLDSAVFHNGELSKIGTPYIIPQETDLVFSYRDDWKRWHPFGPPLIKPTKPNPTRWVEPNKEYIVFLEFRGIDAKGNRIYYSLMPYQHEKSCSMYPIVDGNVLDEKDALGFGKVVPLDVFKQNIRNKIEEIKNYGE